MNTILKATSKGQITLPAAWRRQVNTDRFVVKADKDRLEISPLRLHHKRLREDYTVFDAIRDNRGKGIRASDFVNLLKKTL